VISINFASKNYRFAERLSAGLAAVTVLLTVLLAIQVWGFSDSRAGRVVLEQKLKLQTDREEQVRPILQERAQIVSDLTAMSGLMEARSFSWTRLLTGLETAFPIGVALTKLEFDPKGRALVIEGVAQSPEALRNLMVGLEKSIYFKDPLLKHQSVDKGIISFDVTAFYTDNIAALRAR
jgi:Tfp pilus assembly protein PilN